MRQTLAQILTPAVSDVIDRDSLSKKIASGKKLKIKYGADPSAPNLHLGHFVALEQLRRFSEAGHEVIFLIGDYTGLIGDPTGRNKARPALTPAQIAKNVKTYLAQVALVLDLKKIKVRYNSEWYKKLAFDNLLALLGNFSTNQILERDDFAKRIKAGVSLGMHEVMYPVMQAYDSVVLESDVELGGTDQRFNMLAGRDLQRKMSRPIQDVVIMDLLVGTDGTQKMSKSIGNTIDLTDSAEDMFGKTMSIPDKAVKDYARLVLGWSMDDLKRKAGDDHPMTIKKALAYGMVSRFYAKEADAAREHFERVVGRGEVPSEDMVAVAETKKGTTIKEVIMANDLAASASQLERLATQGGVKLDGQLVGKDDLRQTLGVGEYLLKIGKRQFLKVKVS